MEQQAEYIGNILRGAKRVEEKRERINKALQKAKDRKAELEAVAKAPEPLDARVERPGPAMRKRNKEEADACARHIVWLKDELRALERAGGG